jgi:mannan endo-1,4-beta-mannosidase
MMWHWNAPTDLIDGPDGSPTAWYRGFYTEATTFDVQAVLASPGSSKYNLLVSDIHAIGDQLEKFQNAGVPVIWRPLHEAQGNPGAPGWFWWGAKGPESFKQLWRLMHDELTTGRAALGKQNLHNLIWEYTSSAAYDGFEQWYPGDDVVDIIGADLYTDPSSSMSGAWHDLLDAYNGKKIVALSETGTLPDPALFDERGVHWSYFLPWQVEGDPYGVLTNYTTDQLQAILNHDDVITLDELPILPWKTSQTLIADFDGNGSADGADFLIWQRERRNLPLVTAQADANGDKYVNALDLAFWQRQFGLGASPPSQAVPEPCAGVLMAMAAWIFAGRTRRLCTAC